MTTTTTTTASFLYRRPHHPSHQKKIKKKKIPLHLRFVFPKVLLLLLQSRSKKNNTREDENDDENEKEEEAQKTNDNNKAPRSSFLIFSALRECVFSLSTSLSLRVLFYFPERQERKKYSRESKNTRDKNTHTRTQFAPIQ